MALLFFDTFALVKRYHEENGTKQVDQLIEGEDTVVISSLSIIETISAFRRKYNRDQLTEDGMNSLLSEFFEEALNDFVIIPMEESVMTFSFDLVLEDDLRTLDSLQLSAALSLQTEDEEISFISADSQLVSIANQHDLNAINPAN